MSNGEIPDFYKWEMKTINNPEIPRKIRNEFSELIEDYLESKKDTEESNFFLDWIIWKAKKLEKKDFNYLIDYINQKREHETWDNKLQLLELWSSLINTDLEIEQNEYITPNIDFKIISWKSEKKIKIIKNFKFETKSKYIEESISNLQIKAIKNKFWEFIISFNVEYDWNIKKYNILYKKWNNKIYLIKNWKKYKQKIYIPSKEEKKEKKLEFDKQLIIKDGNRTITFNIRKYPLRRYFHRKPNKR